jgi:hypothetical protein
MSNSVLKDWYEKNSFNDCKIFVICSYFIWLVYSLMRRVVEEPKQRSWLIMMFSSTILSIFGTIYVVNAFMYSLWTNEFIYGDDIVSRTVMIFFLATNVMDLFIGTFDYPQYLNLLSAVVHHVLYSIFVSTLIIHGFTRGFLLNFLMEIPTFIMAVGTVFKEYRSDTLFGATFFITRIVYNIFYAYKLAVLSPNGIIWKICCCALGMHLYWFNTWMHTYGWNQLKQLFRK